MKTKSIFKLTCFMLFLAIGTLAPIAVHGEGEAALTLEQAVDAALKNSYQMAAARNNLENAILAVKQEILKTYPQAQIGDILGADLDQGSSSNTLTITVKETLPTKFNLYGHKIPTNIEVAMWDQLF